MNKECFIRSVNGWNDGDPEILYKYRDFNDSHYKKILTENKIYLSSPRDFEDKMDCNLPESYPKKEELYEIFLNMSKREKPYASRKEHRAYARYWAKRSPLAHPKRLKKEIERYNTIFNQRFGVCSLTADSENPAMWKKYANNSTGICIGFDSLKLFDKIGGGGPVTYVDTLPSIDFMKDDFWEKHRKKIFMKERRWASEKEYRVHKFWREPPTQEERNILMPEGCIVEVILGKNISDENKAEITQLVRSKHPNASLRQSTI